MNSRNIFLSLTLGAIVTLTAACASQPAAAPSQPAPAPAAAPAAAPAVQTSAATAPATTEQDTASAMEKRFQETARSYKTVERDGKTMYCKREKVIGSTIPTMQCYTEAQLRSQIEATEELKKRMRRGGGTCIQTGGCAGG